MIGGRQGKELASYIMADLVNSRVLLLDLWVFEREGFTSPFESS